MDKLGYILLGMAVPLNELAIAFRFFDGVEIFALNVLDQCDLCSGRVVNLAHDGRDGVKPAALRGAPTALARDNLESIAVRPKENWLKNAALGDRIGELVDRFFLELHTRLLRVRPDPPDLDFAYPAA